MRTIFIVLYAVLILGCANNQPPANPTIQGIDDDKFSTSVRILGYSLYENPLSGDFKQWFLRSFIDKKTKAISHQIYLTIGYIDNSRYYKNATDENANILKTIHISSDVGSCSGGCSIHEVVGIEIPDQYLRDHAATGFDVKISAQTGDSLVFHVSTTQINLQLNAATQLINKV